MVKLTNRQAAKVYESLVKSVTDLATLSDQYVTDIALNADSLSAAAAAMTSESEDFNKSVGLNIHKLLCDLGLA